MSGSRFLFVAASFLALALFPLVAGNYGIDLVSKIMVYAILALSLELLVGSTGLVCFGQAAFFGIGAYATVLLSPGYEPSSLLWLLPAGMLAAAAVCAVHGRAVAAHQGRVLHHGHAGVCADGLLRAARHAAGRRHRRHLPQCQAGAGRAAEPGPAARAVRLHAGLPAGRVRLSGAAAALALRPRPGRHPRQRAAHARHRLFHLSLQAGGLRHLRRHRRPGGFPVRGEGRLRQPRDAGLAPVGRGADHDHLRRPGPLCAAR